MNLIMHTIVTLDGCMRLKLKAQGFDLPEHIKNQCSFALLEKNIPIGYAYYEKEPSWTKNAIQIYIHISEVHRRRGLGTELYRFVMNALKDEREKIVSGEIIERRSMNPAYEFCKSVNAVDWQTLDRMSYSGKPFVETIKPVPYRDEYYAALAERKFEAWKPLAADYGFDMSPYSESERKKWMEDADNAFVYLTADGEPVAMCSCGTEGHIHGLFVSRECRGQSIGRGLLTYCVNRVLERGFSRATLSVLSRNTAKRMYYDIGFRVYEVEHYFKFQK